MFLVPSLISCKSEKQVQVIQVIHLSLNIELRQQPVLRLFGFRCVGWTWNSSKQCHTSLCW